MFSSLEKALRNALRSVLEKDGSSDPRTSFYDKFKEEVAEHDDDFHKKYDEDLNTTLIFVSSFIHKVNIADPVRSLVFFPP